MSEHKYGDESHPNDDKSMTQLHSAALREPELPGEGAEPGPWWLYAIILLTITFGFFYMGRYLGEISTREHVLYSQATSGGDATEEAQLDPMEQGARVYKRVCQTCHQPQGEGVPSLYPPLANSDWINGDPNRPIQIVLHGLQGPITVKGESYNNSMPGWGSLLSDADIAAVLTYVRNSFGNSAPDISVDQVASQRNLITRSTPWTITELETALANAPADSTVTSSE